MMFGEVLCLIAFLMSIRKQAGAAKQAAQVPSWIFLVPCLCDWTATTLVNMSYLMLPASVIQMTRGSIVIFTCALSMGVLRRRQHGFHFLGVALVALGITLVSLSTLLSSHAATASALSAGSSSVKVFGLALCIAAQVFQASMIVYEEKIMHGYTIQPLQVVGMEGLSGIGIGIIILSVANGTGFESTPMALYQISSSRILLSAIVLSISSSRILLSAI